MTGAGPLTTVKSAAELTPLPNNKTGERQDQRADRPGWLTAGSTAAAAPAGPPPPPAQRWPHAQRNPLPPLSHTDIHILTTIPACCRHPAHDHRVSSGAGGLVW